MNDFEIVSGNKINFIIETKEKSMAFFDSLDKNTLVYISENYETFKSQKDERITGKLYEIEPNKKYYIRNVVHNNQSVLVKYLYPYEFGNDVIDMSKTNLNFLFLKQNKV